MPINSLRDICDGQISLCKAQIHDVEKILELINHFAESNLMLPRGPQYIYENIRDFVVAVDNDSSKGGKDQRDRDARRILGCGSLHVLWRDIAEVRALAIDPDYQHMGIGMALVEFMKQEARELKIKSMFTFTMTSAFFTELGFKLLDKEELPAKLWGECSRCPKFYKCDEVGMGYDFNYGPRRGGNQSDETEIPD